MDIFVLGQLCVFGGIVSRVKATRHHSHINEFAMGQGIKFNDLDYVADAQVGLALIGFSASSGEPGNPETLTSGNLPDFASGMVPTLYLVFSTDLTLAFEN